MSKPDAPRYTLVFRALDDSTDPKGIRRLRALLKFALRSLRLRCESVIESKDEVSK